MTIDEAIKRFSQEAEVCEEHADNYTRNKMPIFAAVEAKEAAEYRQLVKWLQEKKYCRMIPLEPDCRGYTDVFICTNCHQHIHLGFIRKEYSGSYCLECGAEVEDGDTK